MIKSLRTACAALCVGLVCLVSAALGQELPFAHGDRVVFLGDSITQNGRYVALTELYLWATHRGLDVDIINAGLSSETVSGITEPIHPYPRPNVHDRVERVLEVTKPDWVVVCYGMNDGIYHPASDEIIRKYHEGLSSLIDRIAESKAKVILMTPPVFDFASASKARTETPSSDEPFGYKNPYRDYDRTLRRLGETVKALEAHPAVRHVIDVNDATAKYLRAVRDQDAGYVYGDGVHPPEDGHLVIAQALLAGLGRDSDEVHRTLAGLTDLSRADTEAIDILKPEQAAELHTAAFERFRKRSEAYRNVFTGKDTAAEALSAVESEAIAAADRVTALISVRRGEAAVAAYEAASRQRWEQTIAEMESRNREESYPDDAVLFLGSSSVRLWDSIAEDVSPYVPIQRGFGGSRFSDVAVFAERLIQPHPYRAVVIFVANDVTGRESDHTLEEIEAFARQVIAVSRLHRPEAPVVLVEITPTESRYPSWPKIRRVNDLLKEISLTEPKTHFLPTAEYYLDSRNRPIADYFRSDRLHQNEQGYALWAKLIKRRLDEVLDDDSSGPAVRP